ncbi:MAG: hypothetical protein ACTSY1_02440 [Alphaproteobacteria bacterium]
MAKAQFHKNQRVYVKPVGTWAVIEQVMPQWAKGVEEPIRIFYDIGLGREFGAEEIEVEDSNAPSGVASQENWRMVRGANKWTSVEDSSHHPYPGSFPVIVTGLSDWGGWRVPGSEYDLDPHRIEEQANIVVNAPKMMAMLDQLILIAEENPENLSEDVSNLIQDARALVKKIRAV